MDDELNSASRTPQNGAPANNVYNMPNAGVVVPGGNKGPSRGRLFAITGAAALVILGTGGYVLGYYVPNKPSNVFKTALENTGKGYDSLVDYANNKEVSKQFEKSAVTGDFKVESDSFATDGTFKATSDKENANFSGDIGLGTTRLKVDGVIKDVANSDSPDAYLKISGIKGLGAPMGVPELDTLDGQWVTVDHSFLDTVAKQAQQAEGLDATSLASPSQADIAEAAKVLGETSDKYVFTTDAENAVLTMDKFVGKETVDGKATNHYKVKADKENLKKYVTELGEGLDKTKLNDWAKKNYDKSLSELMNVEDMKKSADGIKSGDTFDLWVNTKTKLVHKVRLADKDNSKNYMDLGLNYDGGDEKPFFIDVKFEEDGATSTGSLKLTLNTKTNEIKAKASLESDATNVTLNVSAKPTSDAVNVDAPEGAITLSEALDKVGLGGYLDLLMSSMDQQASVEDLSDLTITQ